jgi:hypothetical protein
MADKQTNASGDATSQAQSGSAERERKTRNKPEQSDEIQFFDTTIAKMVERDVPDDGTDPEEGKTHKEWVEVMSDHLVPGEKLKRAMDEEQTAKRAEEARKESLKSAEDREKNQNK